MTEATKSAEIVPLPSTNLETYELAADNLEEELWEVLSQYVDLPEAWVTGVLVRVTKEWQEIGEE